MARSIRLWPGNSPAGPSATPGPPGASRLRTMRATPPATGVPGPPGEQAGEADQDQTDRGQETHQSQVTRQRQTDRGQEARKGQTDRASSRSPATRDTGHPADTAGGGYAPAVTATSSSTLSRSRSLIATTGTNQLATDPATPSAIWSRSATQNAPGRRAAGRRGAATSSMRFPGIRAAGPVPVTAGHRGCDNYTGWTINFCCVRRVQSCQESAGLFIVEVMKISSSLLIRGGRSARISCARRASGSWRTAASMRS